MPESGGVLGIAKVPDDLEALSTYVSINEDLVGQRAAGTPKIEKDVETATSLMGRIMDEASKGVPETEVPVTLDEREQRILNDARRLGPLAIQP